MISTLRKVEWPFLALISQYLISKDGIYSGVVVNRDTEGLHTKQIDTWIEQTIKPLPLATQIQVFEEALQAIQKRILQTLSIVTLNAILGRVLYESQQKFPVLLGIKVESVGISLNGLLLQAVNQQPSQAIQVAQITEAVRFFLIELLTVLENLTAGILSKPIYKELHQITYKVHSQSSKDREEA